MYLGYSTAVMDGNTVFSNTVLTGGGGLFLYESAATLRGNRIISNASGNLGGGVYLLYSNATLTGNRIASNSAFSHGAGVDVASCSPTFRDNVISGNVARYGSGIVLWYSRSVLTNNVIADNRATVGNSGLWIGGSSPRLLHTTLARNTGGDGSGVTVTDAGTTHSTVAMTNTIVVGHAVGITVTAHSTVTLDGVLWYGNGSNTGGAGIVTATNVRIGDPAFAPDGYHLAAGSAAIDRGVTAGVTRDMDGQPRLGVPDLGADEYVKSVYFPLVFRKRP